MTEALPGTVAHAALQFLRTQTVEITTLALAEGIGRPVKRLSQQLSPAAKSGILSRRVDAGFAFWKVGPNADKSIPPAAPTPDELGTQRVIKVSAQSVNSIFAYADQRNAAPFSVSLSTDGRAVVERHGRVLLELTNDERKQLVKAASVGVFA